MFDGGATGTDEGEVECVSIPFRKKKRLGDLGYIKAVEYTHLP